MEKIDITPKELHDIMDEYRFDPDPMVNDNQKVRIAKMALSRISEPDRIIFCLALDKQSSREVGRILGCSHSTVLKQLAKIRKDIMREVMKILETEDWDD